MPLQSSEENLPSFLLFSPSRQEAGKIGEKIWENEGGRKEENLTFWKEGENFPSFGIGHFLWYPEGQKERFQEVFPAVLIFLQERGIVLPSWLREARGAPWKSREEFYRQFHSEKMVFLRTLLLQTKDLQCLFLLKRLKEALPKVVKGLSKEEKAKVLMLLHQLGRNSQGIYALVDYVNFKGEGILLSERYKGKGWGLRQVLQGISSSSQNPLEDFIKVAKQLLQERVENSPPERGEKAWLSGWLRRVDSYSCF